MNFSLGGVRKHHQPLIMHPEVPPHAVRRHRPGEMKRKPTVSCLINANSKRA